MHCIKKITGDLLWVGANDRRLAMFEGVYSVPDGVSYNSYLLMDEKTVLFDTVDKAVRHRFWENITEALGKRALDYLVVQHMEPDHSAALMDLVRHFPGMKIICNAKTRDFIKQFYEEDINSRIDLVKEGDTISTGRHTLHFIMAPMVHWPEVMVTYDSADKILFSADAFGSFGALNGAMFADEVDYDKDYMDETRRYYANIVGKYGKQAEALLEKASAFEINMICPLHGFVWREKLQNIISKYQLWSSYTPEQYGVMIAYASVYGNTENAAEILACRLADQGIKTTMYDVSVIPASEIVAAAFKWSHVVFASTTYNAGIFVTMEALINDLVSHNFQNRIVGIIENGSWAAASGGLIRKKLEMCQNITFMDNIISIKSSLKTDQLLEIDSMANALIASLLYITSNKENVTKTSAKSITASDTIDTNAMYKISYGLFVLCARDGDKDNGCIINTVTQITEKPLRISIAVNKANLTHDMITKTGAFSVSVLTESTPFRIFEQFGFHSGRNTDKFTPYSDIDTRTAGGIRYLSEYTNAVMAAKVTETYTYETHSVFIADITQACILSNEPSVTYQYYFDHIKPKPKLPTGTKKGYVCKICGYIHEDDVLPEDFICPWCKHGAADFEPL